MRRWKWNKVQRRIFNIAQYWYKVETTLHNVVWTLLQRWYNIIATLFQRSLNYIEANLSSNKYVFVEFVDR